MPRKTSKSTTPTAKMQATPTAKVEAVAKASATYARSHRTTVKEVVPPDVTRAKASAWLDLISPLTQWAGLKGDALQHKRDILRLHQEVTLTKMAILARQRLPKDLTTLSPIPYKFIVPFLEQASLEEPDSVLVDLWANLLVSASEEFDSCYIHFVSIIARLSASQGEILKEMVRTTSLNEFEERSHRIEPVFGASDDEYLQMGLEEEMEQYKPLNDEMFREFLVTFFDQPGVEVIEVFVSSDITNKRSRTFL
jgi:hypothetical protein